MRSFSDRSVKLALTKLGQGTVRASDIDTPTTVEIVNPHHYICEVDSAVDLAIDLTVERGRSASLADRRDVPLPIGEIAINAVFSPVVRVPVSEVGCWIDGHWGHYAMARLLALAEGLGWPDAGEPVDEDDLDSLVMACDDAEAWLNDCVAPDGCSFGWYDGEFWLHSNTWWAEVTS